jgi:hypothetical protein
VDPVPFVKYIIRPPVPKIVLQISFVNEHEGEDKLVFARTAQPPTLNEAIAGV